VVSCVVFGSTLNRCLSRGSPADTERAPEVRGARLDAAPGPEPPRESRRLPPLVEKRAEEQAPQEGFLPLTFDDLANYAYRMPPAGAAGRPTNQIPKRILDLDGKKVGIRGFMIPIKVAGEDVREFVLVRNQFVCCFGVVPLMNEWLHIKMVEGHPCPYAVDIPITVFGTLRVGEVWEQGAVMSLYRMDGLQVLEPPMFR
jgi:hypothetical protein